MMARPSKEYTDEHKALMLEWAGNGVSNSMIAWRISDRRGAHKTSISAAERDRRRVSREHVRRFLALHKTNPAQNPETVEEAGPLHETEVDVEVRVPEPQTTRKPTSTPGFAGPEGKDDPAQSKEQAGEQA